MRSYSSDVPNTDAKNSAEKWENDLNSLLSKTQRPYLDAVIDSGGGDITGRLIRILKAGAVVVCYGM